MFITTRPAVIARRNTSDRDGIEDLSASSDEMFLWLLGLALAAVREYESIATRGRIFTLILLKNLPSTRNLEGRCLQRLEASETPLGAASDSPPLQSPARGGFSAESTSHIY
jgi:hypothetical protein